jgi:hypothetical protein
MAKTHDKKVRPKTFREYDLVLRNVIALPNKDHSKWEPKYKGLYIVKKKNSQKDL